MLTLTDEAHQAVRDISRSSVPSHVPGLRICRRADRPAFSVTRAVVPEATDQVIEHDGARVFLAPVAALRFEESILDVRRDRHDRLQFVVRPAA
jgi:Fe-S cluster assembly iron-binding protein IscA